MRARRIRPAEMVLLVICAACAPLAPAAPQSSPASSNRAAADEADFEKVCGACHTPGMVSDMRSEGEWRETVEHMVALGAQGTDEQMDAVMRFLLRSRTKVNVNTAQAAQLPLVLNISESVALSLVRYRSEHGPFKTLNDVKKVPGIDAGQLDARKDRIVF